MATDKEKLIAFMQQQGLKQTSLAAVTDIKQQVISRLLTSKDENDKATPALKYALLKHYHYDIDTGEYISHQTENNKHCNVIPIPIYNIKASAGAGTWVDREPEQDVMYFDKRFLQQILKRDNYDSIHIIYAQGDSMDSGWNQPDDIRDGDLLMVDTSQTTGNFQVFVILVNNQELRVKKLMKNGDCLYVTSNNPKYKQEVYCPETSDVEIKVIGKVVWKGSRERFFNHQYS